MKRDGIIKGKNKNGEELDLMSVDMVAGEEKLEWLLRERESPRT